MYINIVEKFSKSEKSSSTINRKFMDIKNVDARNLDTYGWIFMDAIVVVTVNS